VAREHCKLLGLRILPEDDLILREAVRANELVIVLRKEQVANL